MRSQIREGRTRSLQQCLFREFFICGHMLRGTVNRDFYEVWLDFAGSLISIFASFHFYSHGRTRADRDKLMRNAISRVRERGCSTETKSLRCTHIYIFLFTFLHNVRHSKRHSSRSTWTCLFHVWIPHNSVGKPSRLARLKWVAHQTVHNNRYFVTPFLKTRLALILRPVKFASWFRGLIYYLQWNPPSLEEVTEEAVNKFFEDIEDPDLGPLQVPLRSHDLTAKL